MAKLALVVLISGSGSNLQALIDAAASGQIDCEVHAVISNRADAFGLERARRAGIPARVLEHRAFRERAAFDAALADLVDEYRPDLIALAGFMRVLSAQFVDRYPGRIMNIHPSLLPAFPGLDTHARALQAGVAEHGASVHFTTAELDAGPVIVQGKVRVHAEDTPQTLAARVLEVEHRLYPCAVGWFAAGRLECRDGAVWLDGEHLAQPRVLTAQAPC